jgi:hypothetical protein
MVFDAEKSRSTRIIRGGGDEFADVVKDNPFLRNINKGKTA